MYQPDFSFDDIICELCGIIDHKISLVPGGIVSQIIPQQVLHIFQLVIPQVKLADDPLTVLPGVVVLRITLENFRGEFKLLTRVLKPFYNYASVVPINRKCWSES